MLVPAEDCSAAVLTVACLTPHQVPSVRGPCQSGGLALCGATHLTYLTGFHRDDENTSVVAHHGDLVTGRGGLQPEHHAQLPCGNSTWLPGAAVATAVQGSHLQAVVVGDVTGPHPQTGVAQRFGGTHSGRGVGGQCTCRATAMGEVVGGSTPLEQGPVPTEVRGDRLQPVRGIDRNRGGCTDPQLHVDLVGMGVQTVHDVQLAMRMVNDRRAVGTRVTHVAVFLGVVGVLAQIGTVGVDRPQLGLFGGIVGQHRPHVGAEDESAVDPADSVPSSLDVNAVMVLAISQQTRELVLPSGPQPDLPGGAASIALPLGAVTGVRGDGGDVTLR